MHINLVADAVGGHIGHQLLLQIIRLPRFLFIAERKDIRRKPDLFGSMHHVVDILAMLLGNPV